MNVNTMLNSNTGESGNSLWIAFGTSSAGVIAVGCSSLSGNRKEIVLFCAASATVDWQDCMRPTVFLCLFVL